MSPEQLQGKQADVRSDLFSFGCVLYEMLFGKRAFEGESAASVIAAILEREPALLNLAPPLERVVQTCLAKNPDDRFQTARDLRRNLTWALEQLIAQPIATRANRRVWIGAAAASLLMAAIAALAVWKLRPAPPSTRDTHGDRAGRGRTICELEWHRNRNLAGWLQRSLCRYPRRRSRATLPTPFGRAESRASRRHRRSRIALLFARRSMDWFHRQRQAQKLPVGGGTAVDVCDVGRSGGSAFPGATWSPHNTIVFHGTNSMREVPDTGGTSQQIGVNPRTHYLRWPEFTRDGSAIVFASGTNPFSFANKSSIAAGGVRQYGAQRRS